MLEPKEVQFIQEELSTSKNPLFYYDDDPDGLCSFLLLYKIHREGKGIIVKSAPNLDLKFFHKVEENNPDKIFVLDVPILAQEFVDKAARPVFWIDHHELLSIQKVHYFNPQKKDPNAYLPTTRMAYQINNKPEDLWIATVGCVADWHMPDFIDEFIKEYPELLPVKTNLEEAVYKYPLGKLVRIFSFLLKGSTSEVNDCVKILTRIKSPQEILNQETSQARFLYKRFEKINEKYEELITLGKKRATRSRILLYTYTEDKWSFTSELANELTNLYPQKVILIARQKSGEMKCSLRSKKPIAEALKRALVGINGYGGGHPNACGAVIKEEDWKRFLSNLSKETRKVK